MKPKNNEISHSINGREASLIGYDLEDVKIWG